MFHYLFEDYNTGEEFIVGACDLEEAQLIAFEHFVSPVFQYELSEFEAETSGLDEY